MGLAIPQRALTLALMHVQIAVLCDAATDTGGKLSLLGAFDTIQTQQFPAFYPQCAIALRMQFNSVEEGLHKLRINFVNEDGKPIIPSMELEVPVAMPSDSHFVTRNLIVNMNNTPFAKPGLYSVDIAVDGRQEASIPLLVRTIPQGVHIMGGFPGPFIPPNQASPGSSGANQPPS